MLFMNGLDGLKLEKRIFYNLAVKTSDNTAQTKKSKLLCNFVCAGNVSQNDDSLVPKDRDAFWRFKERNT